jgi:hypothetical protein
MLNTHEAKRLDLGILAMTACQRFNFIFRQNDVCSHMVTSLMLGDGEQANSSY